MKIVKSTTNHPKIVVYTRCTDRKRERDRENSQYKTQYKWSIFPCQSMLITPTQAIRCTRFTISCRYSVLGTEHKHLRNLISHIYYIDFLCTLSIYLSFLSLLYVHAYNTHTHLIIGTLWAPNKNPLGRDNFSFLAKNDFKADASLQYCVWLSDTVRNWCLSTNKSHRLTIHTHFRLFAVVCSKIIHF